MMDIIKVIILSIVEGVTEFVPVSSTGHLILANEFVALEPASFANNFNVIIQLGAIMAVVVLYFEKLNPFDKKKDKTERQMTFNVWKRVIVGVLPAMVLGLLFDDIIDEYLFNVTVVALALFIWGLVIVLIEKREKPTKFNTVYDITYRTAFTIGLVQCLAMVPGTSRSAATIIGGMLVGVSRVAAAEFSFFLAIPTMFGATFLRLYKNGLVFTSWEWFLLALGSVLSFIVSLIVIRVFLDYIKKHDFKIFGYYRMILSVVFMAYFLFIK